MPESTSRRTVVVQTRIVQSAVKPAWMQPVAPASVVERTPGIRGARERSNRAYVEQTGVFDSIDERVAMQSLALGAEARKFEWAYSVGATVWTDDAPLSSELQNRQWTVEQQYDGGHVQMPEYLVRATDGASFYVAEKFLLSAAPCCARASTCLGYHDAEAEAVMADRDTAAPMFGRPLKKWPAPKRSRPSIRTMEKWVTDESTPKATDGCAIEPDGVCSHGYPSWLLYLGYI